MPILRSDLMHCSRHGANVEDEHTVAIDSTAGFQPAVEFPEENPANAALTRLGSVETL
jgi:hypothetical protein